MFDSSVFFHGLLMDTLFIGCLLALFYEMKTQLKDAYDWAAKSYEIFNNKKGEDYNYTKMQRLYVEALGKRIRSDQKLNKQFGE